MVIPSNILANADDLGLNTTVNKAILQCFELGYINSTSLLTNTDYFDETIDLINQNPSIKNIGVHVNLAEGKPVTLFTETGYLDKTGNWDLAKINKVIAFLNPTAQQVFLNEICAQIDKALAAKIPLTHIDSHYHLHTLPCFYKLFLWAAKRYDLKIRIAQTFNEGSYLNLVYRKYINQKFKANHINYSDRFETVNYHLNNSTNKSRSGVVEIMLHPGLDMEGGLTDHYDADTMTDWVNFLKTGSAGWLK